MPLTDGLRRSRHCPRLGGRVRCRSIYDAAAMDDPVARRIIQACAEAGEQARLLPSVPMKMKLADHTTAMLPLTPTGTAGALVIRAPVIITALREYFEMLWERATPLKPQRPPSRRRPAAASAAGRPGADGRGPAAMAAIARRARDQHHHGPPPHRGHHGAARTSPAGSPQAPPPSAEAGSGRCRVTALRLVGRPRVHRVSLRRATRWWRASRRCCTHSASRQHATPSTMSAATARYMPR